MPVVSYKNMKMSPVEMPGADNVSKAVPIGKDEGWEEYTMRVFRLGPGGFSPKHRHDWEHVNYVIRGRGQLTIDGKQHALGEKDFAFVPPEAEHQFRNTGEDDFEFICIVPNRGES